MSDDLVYTGVGSRKTPSNVLRYMSSMGTKLAGLGYRCRSGGSGKADLAFERSALAAGGKVEIFTPWPGFDHRQDGIAVEHLPVYGECLRIARELHPNWGGCSAGDRKMLARDVLQPLGRDLKSPSKFLLCWAKNPVFDDEGRIKDVEGGTGCAVRVAYQWKIPVFHFGVREHVKRILAFCGDDAQDHRRQEG